MNPSTETNPNDKKFSFLHTLFEYSTIFKFKFIMKISHSQFVLNQLVPLLYNETPKVSKMRRLDSSGTFLRIVISSFGAEKLIRKFYL